MSDSRRGNPTRLDKIRKHRSDDAQPDPGSVPPGGRPRINKRGSGARQAEKGAILRAQVLDATIDCLARMPYSDVSTSVIADSAGVSRGGMQYYFPTRSDLLRATISHLHRRRLELFRNDLLSIDDNVDAIDHVVNSHWKHLNEREFRAYQELVLAARSEPELSNLLASSYRSFLNEWHSIARELLDWHAEDPEAGRKGNIAHYLLEGMAYGRLAGQLEDAEVEEMLDYVKTVLSSAR